MFDYRESISKQNPQTQNTFKNNTCNNAWGHLEQNIKMNTNGLHYV